MKTNSFAKILILCVTFLFVFLIFKSNFNDFKFNTVHPKIKNDRTIIQSRRDFIIEETKKFMNLKVDQYNDELIQFVRSLIHEPLIGSRNLLKPDKIDYSQYGQSTYMDKIFDKKTSGFFIEAGAYNGEDISNTLFFEIQRNWTGILIEPVPELFESIVSKKRNAYAINVCIAEKYPTVVNFRIANSKSLSGISDLMSKNHKNRVGKTFREVAIPCFSLNTILASIKVKNVDFFSLDLEGAELNVLKSLDLEKFNFESIIVEHNGEKERKEQMQKYLFQNGFKLIKSNNQDDFFLKEKK